MKLVDWLNRRVAPLLTAAGWTPRSVTLEVRARREERDTVCGSLTGCGALDATRSGGPGSGDSIRVWDRPPGRDARRSPRGPELVSWGRGPEEVAVAPLDDARRSFTESIRALTDLRSERLAHAFASVPREASRLDAGGPLANGRAGRPRPGAPRPLDRAE